MPRTPAKDKRLTWRQYEVAKKLGLSRQAVAKMIRDGDLDTVETSRRVVLITAASLARFVTENERRQAAS
jgi:excisionase family DNA binding protein